MPGMKSALIALLSELLFSRRKPVSSYFGLGKVRLLHTIREGATSWEAICEKLGMHPVRIRTREGHVLHQLEDLREAGIIEVVPKSDESDRWDNLRTGRFHVSAAWTAMQAALGISLTTLAELDSPRSVVVHPYFGVPEKKDIDLFVAMPFVAELQPVYEDHIQSVATSLGMSVMRADNFFTSHSVISDVWRAIYSARAVIADCTGRNPNVFYEIGLAHAIGKPVILIAQTEEDVPFDVRHLRYLRYSLTPRGMRDFEQKLGSTISETLTDFAADYREW